MARVLGIAGFREFPRLAEMAVDSAIRQFNCQLTPICALAADFAQLVADLLESVIDRERPKPPIGFATKTKTTIAGSKCPA